MVGEGPSSGKNDNSTGENGDLSVTFSGLLGDRYEVIATLGQGGMGTVLKARHASLNKTVAIKVLNASVVVDKISRSRFEQEAQAGSKLSHPNLVAVFDYGVMPTREPYLVMEYIEGESLEQLLEKRRKLDFPTFKQIFSQVCKGLQYVHKNCIVHRDIKTSNIMLQQFDGELHVKLLDFGIAKVLDNGNTSQNLTATGTVFGSPLYMSPEQCMGQKTDARSDIYSLGCVMYECLTGYPPFKGENALQTLFMHINQTVTALDMPVRTEEEVAVVSLILKCLEKDPIKRIQSAGELLAVLAGTSGAASTTGGISPSADFARAQKWSQRTSAQQEKDVSSTRVSAQQSLKQTINHLDQNSVGPPKATTQRVNDLPSSPAHDRTKMVGLAVCFLVLIPSLFFAFNFTQSHLANVTASNAMKKAEEQFALGPDKWDSCETQFEALLSQPNLDEQTRGRIKARLGRIYLQKRKFNTASDYMKEAKNLLRANPEANKEYILDAVFGMAQALVGCNARPRADEYFAEASQLARQWDEPEHLAEILVAWADSMKDRDWDRVNKLYDEAIQLYSQLPKTSDSKLAGILADSADALSRTDRAAEAPLRAKQALTLAENIADAKVKARIQVIAHRFDTTVLPPAPPPVAATTPSSTATTSTTQVSPSSESAAAQDQLRLVRDNLEFSRALSDQSQKNFQAVTKQLKSFHEPAYRTVEGQQMGDYARMQHAEILNRLRQQGNATGRF